MAKIVLASKSPRRQELLKNIGITEFDIRVPEADESFPAGLTPQQVVEHISRVKAEAAVALCSPDEIVITADTMVFLDDQRLGKPADEADALRMLTALQGRCHTVCTGVTVRRGEESLTECETTEVRFRTAAERELRGYIATGEPMDKAGSYGIQGYGAMLVEGISGDYFNVVGLPLCRLYLMLKELETEM
jgi:septum formation protein